MKKKKVEIIRKRLDKNCYACKGKGCDICTHYIFITNGIAIDGDTLK